MNVKSPFLTFLLFFCTTIAFAQNDNSFKRITITSAKDIVFDKTIDYLQDKGYFIQSLDKQAGFIQAKVFLTSGGLFSAKAGERRTMNLILRPADNNTDVTLNIYVEQVYLSSSGRYYEDKGILNDTAVYKGILAELQKTIN